MNLRRANLTCSFTRDISSLKATTTHVPKVPNPLPNQVLGLLIHLGSHFHVVPLPIAMAVAIRVLLFLLLLPASAEPAASAAAPAVSAWEKWMDRLVTCAVTCLFLAAWRGSSGGQRT